MIIEINYGNLEIDIPLPDLVERIKADIVMITSDVELRAGSIPSMGAHADDHADHGMSMAAPPR